jgi:hypothetical protein
MLSGQYLFLFIKGAVFYLQNFAASLIWISPKHAPSQDLRILKQFEANPPTGNETVTILGQIDCPSLQRKRLLGVIF